MIGTVHVLMFSCFGPIHGAFPRKVHTLVTPSSWALLYESVTEELCLRARCAAHALCVPWIKVGDGLEI